MHATTLEDAATRRTFLYPIRWGAIFAGMAVGIALHLLLMVIGVALGLAVFEVGDRPDAETLSTAAAAWNGASMLVGAFIGGYIAARASGLRRLSDGVLHGAVSWGATTLLFAALTMSAAGGALSGLYSTIAPRVMGEAMEQGSGGMVSAMSGQVADAVRRGDREGVVSAMQDSMGMSAAQANRAADVALAAAGRGEVSPQAERQAERAAEAGATATGWLAGAILLSLIVALIGGALGARGARRFTRLQHRVPADSPAAARPTPAGEVRLS
jgi:MFS family permease